MDLVKFVEEQAVRIFPVNSPNIEKIDINSVGKVRRAKLFYLRGLTGKAARIKSKRV